MRNIHGLYTKLYGKLYNRNGVPGFVMSPLRRFLRVMAAKQLPHYLMKAPFLTPKRQCEDVVVSLTSFPARIENVWMTISCLLRQTYLPYKIVLWLSKDQFPSKYSLPSNLTSLENDCFEIRMVEGDIRSHKKYFYAFAEFPDKLIITVDDDLIYAPDLVESLVSAHELYPNDVLCRYGKLIGRTADGNLLPYNKWKVSCCIDDSDIFFGSGGGTLFKPEKMYKDVLDIKLSQELTPLADDIWLNAMSRLANLRIRLITRELFFFFDKDESNSLSNSNVGLSMNDKQLNDIINYYVEKRERNPFKKVQYED